MADTRLKTEQKCEMRSILDRLVEKTADGPFAFPFVDSGTVRLYV